MSYSRYTDSRFYTFWSGDDTFPTCKEEEIFEVDCEFKFTYQELTEDIERCLDIANIETTNPSNAGYGVPLEQTREELRGYMNNFIEDMDLFYQKRRMNEREAVPHKRK